MIRAEDTVSGLHVLLEVWRTFQRSRIHSVSSGNSFSVTDKALELYMLPPTSVHAVYMRIVRLLIISDYYNLAEGIILHEEASLL